MDSWIQTTVRKLHLDYHQPPWMESVAVAFTEAEARKQVQLFKEAGIEAVEFFAFDHYGQAFYPSDIAPRHPHLQTDYTGLMYQALKEGGLRTILYLNAFTSVHLNKIHPDWIRQNEDGSKPKGAWLQHESSHICINSAYLEQFFVPLMKEAVNRHLPDGVWIDAGSWLVEVTCYCDNCKDRYWKDTGCALPSGLMPSPSEELDSPDWVRWHLWKRGLIAPYIRQVVEAIKSVAPDCLVAENNLGKYFTGVPLIQEGQFVKWLIPSELGIDWLSCDPVHFGANHEMVLSREARYQATTGLPFDFMNERFHGWGEWQLRSPTDWKLEMATMMSIGSRCFIADQPYPDGTLEPMVYQDIRKAYDFVKERQVWIVGTAAIQEVAILASLPSQLLGPHAGAEWGRDLEWGALPKTRMDRVDGASLYLTEAGIHHLIYDEATLLVNLSHLSLVIVPDQCLMEQRTILALEQFVESGGRIIVTGRSGLWMEQGERRTEDLFASVLGLKRKEVLPSPLHYWQADRHLAASMEHGDMKLQVWGTGHEIELEGAVPLAEMIEPVSCVWNNGGRRREDWLHYTTVGAAPPGETVAASALTTHSFGKGTAIYMNTDLFALYYLEGHRITREWLNSALHHIFPSAERKLIVKKPLHVEVTLSEKREEGHKVTLVHLINYFSQKRPGYIVHNEEVPPLLGIELSLKMATKPDRILQQPEGITLEWTWDGTRTSFVLPELHLHAIIEIVEQL